MSNWEYGGAYQRVSMDGMIRLPGGSIVAVCDWTERLPEFMLEADTLFIDPPWNAGNVRSFYTKAGIDAGPFDFMDYSRKLWGRITEIAPQTIFIEMGKEHIGSYLEWAKTQYPYVTFYNSTYYKRTSNKCYVIHATQHRKIRRYACLEDMDEENIIAWICKECDFSCIGDLCMGRGLVGKYAYLAGKRFVGTELNVKRLAVLVEFIQKHEEKAWENGILSS